MSRTAGYRVVPTTIAQARAFVAKHHSHNPLTPTFYVCTLGIADATGELIGVAIGGRTVARGLPSEAGEITRVCIAGQGCHPNACSMAYGNMRTALAALGRTPIYTYTLAEENGSCVRAAGFRKDADLKARASWDCPSRNRVQTDLFGDERRPAGPKTRWVWR